VERFHASERAPSLAVSSKEENAHEDDRDGDDLNDPSGPPHRGTSSIGQWLIAIP
jgi:hypothetical protein